MTYSDKFSHTATIEKPGKGTVTFEQNPEYAKAAGYGDYYLTEYKKDDTTLRVGFSISF